MSKIDIVLGLHWGDEGKGKIVDFLSEKYDIIARFQGGPNADHGIYYNGKEIVLRTIPSGIIHEDKICVIGSGMVINPLQLVEEIKELERIGVKDVRKRLFISEKAHIITPAHRLKEIIDSNGISTTGSAIGPTYASKSDRKGFRFIDFYTNRKAFEKRLRDFSFKVKDHYESDDFFTKSNYTDESLIKDINSVINDLNSLKDLNYVNLPYFINDKLKEGKTILAEGAQGTLLDIDNGTYPYVTSTNTTASEVCSSLGVGPTKIGKVYGIVKAYTTRIGNGQFPTELLNDMDGNLLREYGHEYAGDEPRRCGWLDLPALKYSCLVNGVTDLILTKIDILDNFNEYKVCVAYSDGEMTYTEFPTFPFKEDWNHYPIYETIKSDHNHLRIKELIESETNIKISIASDGPKRENTHFLN